MPPAHDPATAAGKKPTSWFGVATGLGLGALAAYHLFKLPPILPLLLQQYDYGMFAAGTFMSIYAAIGLAISALVGSRIQRHGMPPFLLAAALFFILGSKSCDCKESILLLIFNFR